jgi:uncharacterized membrane protein YdjX (TVP38/TMEM64 family)
VFFYSCPGNLLLVNNAKEITNFLKGSILKKILKRFIPLFILVIFMCLIYFSGIYHYISFDTLKTYHKTLKEFVEHHFVLVSFLYILTYICATAISFPGAIILTFFGGYLFPEPLSAIYVVFSATCGASIVFFVSKTAIGNSLRDKAIPFLRKMEKGFKENGISYLLFLRFVPIFPFWILNIASAFFDISLKTFIWTTALGITPGAIVFTLSGAGLSKVFEDGSSFSIQTVLNTQIKIALCLLGLLALTPVLVKKIIKQKK